MGRPPRAVLRSEISRSETIPGLATICCADGVGITELETLGLPNPDPEADRLLRFDEVERSETKMGRTRARFDHRRCLVE